jgi:hypothetical protein
MHAADVLHACYYLTTQGVPDLIQSDPTHPKNLKGKLVILSKTTIFICNLL